MNLKKNCLLLYFLLFSLYSSNTCLKIKPHSSYSNSFYLLENNEKNFKYNDESNIISSPESAYPNNNNKKIQPQKEKFLYTEIDLENKSKEEKEEDKTSILNLAETINKHENNIIEIKKKSSRQKYIICLLTFCVFCTSIILKSV